MSDINYRERLYVVFSHIRDVTSEVLNYLSGVTSNVASKIIINDDNNVIKDPPYNDLIDAVEAARQEWLTAKKYFESVTDPDLIDHAVYLMEAAQRKYMYLLKKARQEGVKVEFL
ncbi:MAG TPA: YaaL family protein [Thermoanaerobacterales bacterium]|nr:YaaL family protein [Thermoanaerobacterales bacterium]